ncbi:MAG TPA: hypothetical protein PK467_14435 [Candidatus Wallbacteria bacterium]|nr:hypothetical protein [Candidatus Wallbacteria bacterium]
MPYYERFLNLYNSAKSAAVKLKEPAVIFLMTLVLNTAAARLAVEPVYAQGESASALSELEPSDDYRPDGYYEPYDFSFVKTGPASETPPPTKHPLPPEAYGEQPFTGEQPVISAPDPPAPPQNPPQGGYNDPSLGPDAPAGPADAVISVPDPPDFNALTAVQPAGQQNSVVTDFSNVQNPFNETGAAPETKTQPAVSDPGAKSPPAGAGKAAEAMKFFVRRGKKPLRFKFSSENFSANFDRIIGGKNLMDANWQEIYDALLSAYNGAVSDKLSSAEPLDEEFERINSVLITYMLSYGGPNFDSVIVKYKNYYFAFLGPLASPEAASGFKPANPEAKYKLLRLLGGDIIKIISGNTIMFSLKPLSFCVNDIMREVANGEFYKLEVLFRVMTSADAPVRNLVRPFFQLLKSKIAGARDLEKVQQLRTNYSKAYELLNKIK